MNRSVIAFVAIFSFLAMLAAPAVSAASTPNLTPPPASFPAVTYYTNPAEGTHYTITTPEWNSFFTDIIDNGSYLSYNWTLNVYQPIIIFDLSYSGLNYYGQQFVVALSNVGGFPSLHNMSLAFNQTKNLPSMINGYTNFEALNAGAYPAYSWSVPIVHDPNAEYIEIGSIVAVVAATFILYFVFNRKK